MFKTNLNSAATAAQAITFEHVQACLDAIGTSRIGPYHQFFGCKDATEALGAYLWGQAIAQALTPLVSHYEIVLRNAIHRAASQLSSKGTSLSHPWYDYTRADALPTKGKSRTKIAALLYDLSEPGRPLRKASQPAPDQVVASLSFGFWPNFLDGLTKREQPRILTDVFVHHPHGSPRHWGQSERVRALIQTIRRVLDLRNHIAHHEPVWKPHRLSGTESNWTQSVRSLRVLHAGILDVMGWCCVATPRVYAAGHGSRLFSRLCTTDAVRTFMRDPFTAIQPEP